MQEAEPRLPVNPALEVGLAGERIVTYTGDRIQVDVDGMVALLAKHGAAPFEPLLPDGTLVLDSAGEHRYRFVERDRLDARFGVYERIKAV